MSKKKRVLFCVCLLVLCSLIIPYSTARSNAEPEEGYGNINRSSINNPVDSELARESHEILILTDSVLITAPKKGKAAIPDLYSNITDSTTKNRLVTGMMAATEGGGIYKGIVYRNMTTDLPGVDYPEFCTDKGGARPEFTSDTWVWINDYCNYGGYSPGNSYQINHTYYPPWENCVPDGGAVKLYLYCNVSGGQLFGAFNMTTLPPVADFSANATSGSAPLAIQFYDASQNFPSARVWSFGDGGISTETHPVHVFTSPGTYTISLSAANAGGNDTEIKTGYVNVTGGGTPPSGEYILIANFSQANAWGGAAVSNHHIAGVAWNNWTNVTKLVIDGHFYDYGIGSDTCTGSLRSDVNYKNIGTFSHTYTTLMRNSYNAEAHLEYVFAWTSNSDPGASYLVMVNDDCSDIVSFSGGIITQYPPYGPNRANVGSIGSLSNASIRVYGPPPIVQPLANFTATPLTGPAPLTVNFTDTSTNSPTSWIWNFGDGSNVSYERNPVHGYASAGSYTVSHAATNAAGTAWVNRTAAVNVTGSSPTLIVEVRDFDTNGLISNATIRLKDYLHTEVVTILPPNNGTVVFHNSGNNTPLSVGEVYLVQAFAGPDYNSSSRNVTLLQNEQQEIFTLTKVPPPPQPVTNTFSITYVETYGDNDEDLSPFGSIFSSTINNRLNYSEKWPVIFIKNDEEVTKDDFGIDGGGLNDATFHFHFSHGQIQTALQGATYLKLTNYQNVYAYDVQNKWGKNNKWVMLQSCNILNDTTWAGALNSTHGILGYKTTVGVASTDSMIRDFFVNSMDQNKTLIESYRNATKYGVQYIKNKNVTARIIFGNEQQALEDHLPGHGTIAPDANMNDPLFIDNWSCWEV